MCEYAMSNGEKPGVARFDLASDMLMNVLFFVLSNPLYFSYLIFFSPYLIKLLSFLSPLFVTTALLLLAFLTTLSPSLEFPEKRHDSDANDNANDAREDGEEEYFPRFEESEAYKIVFDTSSLVLGEDEVEEEPVDKCLIVDESDSKAKVKQLDGTETVKWCLEEEDEEEEKEKEEEEEKKTEKKEESLGSCFASPEWDSDEKWSVKTTSKESELGSFGSMRKEKEWRRTLACKLFEERHKAVEGSEGMDLLWETYESESDNLSHKSSVKSNKSKQAKNGVNKRGKKGGFDYSEEEEDEDEYEDEANGQLCCLQALKFSAGKVNLGMGKPNLVKISKAFKGMGWLHNVTRHAKKRYN